MAQKKKSSGLQAAAAQPAESPENKPGPISLDWRSATVLALAFVSGAALMTLEIVGGRIVAAHLGSHVFMWGAVIGVFMGSLSLGYYAGGKLGDRFPATWLSGSVTAASGLAVLIVPLIGNPVCRTVSASLFTANIELAARLNPLIAVTIVFFAPATLLGTITPISIRLLAREMKSLGQLSGKVYALNALGSILGTLVTAFILMSVLGNTWILTATGVLLLMVGATVTFLFRSGSDKKHEFVEKLSNNVNQQGTKKA